MNRSDDAVGDANLRTDGGGQTQRGDGGVPESERAAAFRTDTDYSMTRGEQLREFYDQRFYAPVQILLKDYRGVLGLLIILSYLFMGTLGTNLVQPPSQSTQSLVPWFETAEYPLGTDAAGRDILAMTVHATPKMIQLMIGGALFATLLSVGVGVVSGYKMGMTDRILMTITDTALNLPGLPLLIVIVAVLEPRNPFLIGVILSINSWAGGARALRSQVLQIRSEDHVEAARAMGVSTSRNLQKNVLPQLLPLITISAMTSARGIIYAAVGLYYLNILPTDLVNWGVMLNEAYQVTNFSTFSHIHFLITPLVAISVLGIGLILLAQAFDRVFNPRLRAKHSKTIRGGGDDEDEADSSSVGAMIR